MILNRNIASKLSDYRMTLIFGLLFLSAFSINNLINELDYDDASYVSHAFTIGLDFDLNYENEPVDEVYLSKKMPPHPIGAGFLASPFVGLFSIIDIIQDNGIITDHSNYQNSWSLFGFVFSNSIFFFIGIYIYIKSFKLLSLLDNDNNFIIILILSSTVPFFVLNRYFFSHSYEFFSVSMLFWCLIKIYYKVKNNKSIFYFTTIYAFCFSLNLFIRYSNINLLLLPPIIFMAILFFLDNKSNTTKSDENKIILVGLLLVIVGIISSIPNSIFLNFSYGSFLPKPSLIYDKPLWFESYSFFEMIIILLKRIPYIFNMLLSSEMGLLYTNPVIPIGFVSAFFLIIKKQEKLKKNKFLIILLICLIICFFGFGFSIHLWWQGMASSYGYRYLLQTFPVALLFIFICKKYLFSFRSYYKRTIIVLAIISTLSMVFFSSTPLLKLSSKVNVFKQQKKYSGNGYMIDLCKEIIKPYTWLRVIAKGPIGVMASPLITKNNIGSNYIDKRDDYKKYYLRSKIINKNISIQILLLFFTWVLFGYRLDSIRNKS